MTGGAPQGDQAGVGDDSEARAETRASAPDVLDALRELRDTGFATLGAGREAATAFRILLLADISLARSAFGRTLALTGAAIAFGASAWLLLMAALITLLARHTALGWTWSLLITSVLSLVGTVLATWLATRYFEHTRMKATRRQLARIGIGELAGFMPDAASSQSTDDSAKAVAEATQDHPIKKDMGVDVTPP